MPQLQKAMPDAAAPVRKFLRVVMFLSPESRVSLFGRSIASLFLIASAGHIAKVQAIEQSFSRRRNVRSLAARSAGFKLLGAASGFRRTQERSSRERWNP
jgi:hypothetical protein